MSDVLEFIRGFWDIKVVGGLFVIAVFVALLLQAIPTSFTIVRVRQIGTDGDDDD